MRRVRQRKCHLFGGNCMKTKKTCSKNFGCDGRAVGKLKQSKRNQ